jgi:hypothetical protein
MNVCYGYIDEISSAYLPGDLSMSLSVGQQELLFTDNHLSTNFPRWFLKKHLESTEGGFKNIHTPWVNKTGIELFLNKMQKGEKWEEVLKTIKINHVAK